MGKLTPHSKALSKIAKKRYRVFIFCEDAFPEAQQSTDQAMSTYQEVLREHGQTNDRIKFRVNVRFREDVVSIVSDLFDS